MKKWIFLLLFACPLTSQTICLNMIVRNESPCILTCLESVKDWIDYWVIVDTGSNDGTQKMIQEFLKEIPGELHERKWVNFEVNRNEAYLLAKSKADYCLFIDADEKLLFSPGEGFPTLDNDCYQVVVDEPAGTQYHRILLVKNQLPWKWVGVMHETILCPEAKSHVLLKNVVNFSDTKRGNRSKDPKKYLNDAKILEKELEKDPLNARNAFFLAQSYLSAEDFPKALKNYQKRVEMGGWEQEVFFAKYMVASLQEKLGVEPEIFIQGYKEAHQFRPTRIEPLYELAKYYIRNRLYREAYEVLQKATCIPLSSDAVFVTRWVYEWGALYLFAECCAQLGKAQELKKSLKQLVSCKNLPLEKRRKVEGLLSNASLFKNDRSD